MLELILLNAFFAATYPLAQGALQYSSATLLVAVRMIGAGTLFLLYALSRRQNIRFFTNKAALRDMLTIACVGLFLPFLLECWALKFLSALQANVVYLLNPLISAFLSYVFEAQKLTVYQWVGIGVSSSGACLFVFLSSATTNSLPFLEASYALVALLISMTLGTYSWFIFKRLAKKYPPVVINGWTMLGAGALSVCFYFFETSGRFVSLTPQNWISFGSYTFFLVIIGNIVIYSLYARLLKKWSITLITLAQLTCPFFGVCYDYLLFGRSPTLDMIGAFSVVCLGIIIFTKSTSLAKFIGIRKCAVGG